MGEHLKRVDRANVKRTNTRPPGLTSGGVRLPSRRAVEARPGRAHLPSRGTDGCVEAALPSQDSTKPVFLT